MRKAVNAFVRGALYEFFENEVDFHACAAAENGREAIEEARRLTPDLIVLDLAMPLMRGLDAARVLKKKMMTKVPLIIYSATQMRPAQNWQNRQAFPTPYQSPIGWRVLIDKARSLAHRGTA